MGFHATVKVVVLGPEVAVANEKGRPHRYRHY